VRKGSDLLVEALENEGVERIFGVPGEENLDVVESLRKSRIALVLTRHEQAAAFMAATYGRLTGKPGVCITTLGPGALNLTTGAAYALLGAMPMVMITGQKAIRSSRQARFQIVDIVATMRPLTKMATQIVSAQSIPTLVRDAFRVAQQERPGGSPSDSRAQHDTQVGKSRAVAEGEAVELLAEDVGCDGERPCPRQDRSRPAPQAPKRVDGDRGESRVVVVDDLGRRGRGLDAAIRNMI